MSGITPVKDYLNEEIKFNIPFPKSIPKPKIRIIEPRYTIFQIIPDRTVTNKSNDYISRALAEMRYNLRSDFKLKKMLLNIYLPDIFFFDVYMDYNRIEFYLSIPESKVDIILPTMRNVWDKCAIKKIFSLDIDNFDLDQTSGAVLRTLKHNLFSLKCDYRESTPLSHILENQKTLSVGEKIRINICGQPKSKLDWVNEAQQSYIQLQNGTMPDKIAMTPKYFIMKGLKIVDRFFFEVNDFMKSFFQSRTEYEIIDEINKEIAVRKAVRYVDPELTKMIALGEISNDTKAKKTQSVFKTDVRILVQSSNSEKRNVLIKSLTNNYNTISKDNEFTSRTVGVVKLHNKIVKRKPSKLNNTILSTDEISKLNMLPTGQTQEDFKHVLRQIDIKEVPINEELFRGEISLGTYTMKAQDRNVTFGTHIESNSKPVVLLGEQSGGKTTYDNNYMLDALCNGDTVVCPDVADGKLITNTINYLPKDFPEDHIVILDYSHPEYVLPIGLNEVGDSNLHGRDLIVYSNYLTQSIMGFLNTLSAEPLSPKMVEIFSSAGRLVFRNANATVIDLMNCLTDYDVRHKFIEESGLPETSRIVQDMLSMDSKEGGTKNDRSTQGITDRMSLLVANEFLEIFLSQKPNPQISFDKWCNSPGKYGYFVGIRIPKGMFLDQATDTMVTLMVSRLWLTILTTRLGKEQDSLRQVHLVLDEPHQYSQIFEMLKNPIIESRKWRLRFVFSTHNFRIFKDMQNQLHSAGASYIIMKTNNSNVRTLKNIIHPFTEEDINELKEFHALCSINYRNHNYNFITLLPLPPNKSRRFIDRNYMFDKSVKEYGIKYEWE